MAVAGDVLANLPDLGRELVIDYLPPDLPTFALFIGACLETGKLGSALPDKGVESD